MITTLARLMMGSRRFTATSPLIFPTVSRGSPTSSQASSQRLSWSLASALVG